MEKRRQLAALLGMLLLSTGIASLGYSVVSSWSGKVYIDGGSLDYFFRTGGGVSDPSYGPNFLYPLTGTLNAPGNATIPFVRCDVYNVYVQMGVGVHMFDHNTLEDTTCDASLLPTDDILTINYSTVIRVQSNESVLTLPAASINGLEIRLSKSAGIVMTSGVVTSFSKDHDNFTVSYIAEEIQIINSTPYLASWQCDVEVPFEGNLTFAVDASWSIAVHRANGEEDEFFNSSGTLATWKYAYQHPTNDSSFLSASGELYCFYGWSPLRVTSVAIPIIEILLTAAGSVVLAGAFALTGSNDSTTKIILSVHSNDTN